MAYEDSSGGIWDDDDKAWIYRPTKYETVERFAAFDVEVSFDYSPAQLDDVDIDVDIVKNEFAVRIQPTDRELK